MGIALLPGPAALAAGPNPFTLAYQERPQASAEWQAEPKLPVATAFPVQRPAAIGNHIYVIADGTSRLFDFDIANRRWSDRQAPLPQPRHHFAVVVSSGKLYTIGGCTGMTETDRHEPVATVEEYDPRTNEWRNMAPLPQPRRNIVAAEYGGKIYVVGGENLSGAGLPVLVFEPAANRWQSTPHMIPGPQFGAAHAWNGRIYLAGSSATSSGKNEMVVREYDPATGQVSVISRFPAPRGAFGAVSVDRWLYLVGGAGAGDSVSAVAERYDASRNVWETLPPLPVARFGAGLAVSRDRIYVVGGATAPNQRDASVYSLPHAPAAR